MVDEVLKEAGVTLQELDALVLAVAREVLLGYGLALELHKV